MRRPPINQQVTFLFTKNLEQSSTFLGVINIETNSQYTRVWYKTQIVISDPWYEMESIKG